MSVTQLIIASSMALAAPTSAPAYEDINIGGTQVRFPIPDGYCRPEGKQVAAFQALAAPDTMNVTLMSLLSCNGNGSYLLVKSPVGGLATEVDRATVINEASKAFTAQEAERAAFQAKVNDKIGARKSESYGSQVKIEGDYGYRGYDDVCAYLGGLVVTSAAEESQSQAAAGCMTAAAKKVIFIFSYENSTDPLAYKKLFPKLKAMALGMTPTP